MPVELDRLILGVAVWKLLLVVLGVVLVAVLVLGWRLKRWWDAVRLGHCRRRGVRGESQARRLLESAGYTVVARQECATGALLVDGERTEFEVRLDVVVEKGGRRLVAEVKTGAVASVAARATRRQLLEYVYVLGLDAILLVDVPAGRIRRVEFPGITTPCKLR